jgi:hypothetical protein
VLVGRYSNTKLLEFKVKRNSEISETQAPETSKTITSRSDPFGTKPQRRKGKRVKDVSRCGP